MKKRFLSLLICLTLLLGLLSGTVMAATQINAISLSGLRQPVAGQVCSTFNAFTTDTAGVSFDGVDWFDVTADRFLEGTDKFIDGHQYRVEIYVSAADGYTFKCQDDRTPTVTATIDGKKMEVVKRFEYKAFAGAVLCYTFPKNAPEETLPETCNHTLSGWRTNQAYHYKVCTTCGEFLIQEDHTGGRATCAEKGKCTVCGYEYLETTEDHIPDTSKWYNRAGMYHFHKCTLCGAHCDIEDHKWSPRYHPVDARGHAYQCADCKGYDTLQPHNPGPAATETAPQTCKDCNYIIAPAKNHTHSLTRVEEVAPTCDDPGVNAYYACAGCSQKFVDAEGKEAYTDEEALTIPPQGHKLSNGWGFDDKTHWRICAECNEKMIETDMVHQLQDGKCTTCEYDENAAPEDTQGTETPTTEATEPQPEKKGLSVDLPWWLILLTALVAAGGGIGVALLLVRKKK